METVEDATKANQPGNLIFFEDEVPCCHWLLEGSVAALGASQVADKMVTKILKSVTENLPEDSRYVVLPKEPPRLRIAVWVPCRCRERKDTEGTWENRGVSFGHRGPGLSRLSL